MKWRAHDGERARRERTDLLLVGFGAARQLRWRLQAERDEGADWAERRLQAGPRHDIHYKGCAVTYGADGLDRRPALANPTGSLRLYRQRVMVAACGEPHIKVEADHPMRGLNPPPIREAVHHALDNS